MRRPAAALLAMMVLTAPAPALGQEAPRVPLRAGSHADHGRLVFDWASRVPYSAEQDGERVVVRFAAPGRIDLSGAGRPPRNVLGVAEEDGAVVIRAAPGARLRHFRLGNRVVVDLLDAAPGAPPTPATPASRNRPAAREGAPPPGRRDVAAPPPAAARAAVTVLPRPPGRAGAMAADASGSDTESAGVDAVAAGAGRPASQDAAAPAAAPGSGAEPARAVPPAVRPDAAAAAPPPPSGVASSPASLAAPDAVAVRPLRDAVAIAVPAAEGTGLAMFRRGEVLHVVFDRTLVLDLGALRGHPVFAGLEALPAADATLLRLRLPAPARLAARRDGAAWVIEATREPSPPEAPVLRAVAEPGPPARLLLRGIEEGVAGGPVALADPETGEPLLVATLRRPGPGVALARRLPELELLPSMMGAAVLARSDRVALRPVGAGIAVQAAWGGSLALGAAAGQEPPAQVLALTRLLDLPVAPVPALMERLRMQLLAVNEAPPLGRGARRRDAAETLLALGLPQEAQAMAGLGLREDPQAREDARMLLAQGAATLLAGRPAEARGILDPRLPPRDEVALWRALLAATEGEAGAASALVAGAPLLLAYPESLRARLLPLALEAMAEGGEAATAARLLAEAEDVPGLGLARAMLAEAAGRRAEALDGFAAVAQGRDRRQRAVALRRAAELRLAAGEIDAAAAAAALEQALAAWRGGAEEVTARRRIAALRIEAGQGTQAFALLDETSRLFPDDAAALRPDLGAAFAAALETAPPLAAATLFDAHPDLLPEGSRGEAAVLVLADRLAGLDLPARAAALLERAAQRAGASARPAIGARLAGLRLEDGDAAAALAALDSTRGEEMAQPVATQRALVRARALARRGARQEAASVLATLGPAGAEARAELHAEAQDWPAAVIAQREHLAASLPPAPAPLAQAGRAAVARAAAYAALAGDDAALAELRVAYGARMESGPLAEAFAMLTADPLRGVADLPRLHREIGVLRAMPSRLEALRGAVQVAR